MNYSEVIKKLKSLKNPRNAEGMARFGIRPKTKVFGIPIPELRKLAKIIKKDHKLALKLFDSGIHEARILAGFIADAGLLTEKQMDKWINGFDSWDVVDQVCLSLFDKASFIYKKVFELAKTRQKPKRHLDGPAIMPASQALGGEFQRRTAFTLIACLAVHGLPAQAGKKMKDKDFLKFFPLIKKASTDERNFVKKAVNWALRQIGKRNKNLNKKAIKLAK